MKRRKINRKAENDTIVEEEKKYIIQKYLFT